MELEHAHTHFHSSRIPIEIESKHRFLLFQHSNRARVLAQYLVRQFSPGLDSSNNETKQKNSFKTNLSPLLFYRDKKIVRIILLIQLFRWAGWGIARDSFFHPLLLFFAGEKWPIRVRRFRVTVKLFRKQSGKKADDKIMELKARGGKDSGFRRRESLVLLSWKGMLTVKFKWRRKTGFMVVASFI